jgi:hypothetical protein
MNINEKGYPVYHIRSDRTRNLYNCGSEQGVTVAGFITGLYTKPKATKVVIEQPIVEDEVIVSVTLPTKKQNKPSTKEKSKKPAKVTDFFEV